MPGWPCVPTPARHSPPCGGSTSCRRRPLPCCPSPRCLASAHAVAGEHGARRRPNVVAPVPGVGTRCGRRTRCPASTQRCYRCGSTSPRRPVQCCPAPRWSVLADTAAGNRRRHAARIAVGRRHHSSPFSVAQHHAGRFWQTLRLALAAVRLLADTEACPRRRHAIRHRVHGAPCSVPSSSALHHFALGRAPPRGIVLLRIIRSASCCSPPHDHPDTPLRSTLFVPCGSCGPKL